MDTKKQEKTPVSIRLSTEDLAVVDKLAESENRPRANWIENEIKKIISERHHLAGL